MKDEKSEM